MKFKFMSMAALAAMVAFTACTNDDEPAGNNNYAALSKVSVGIDNMTNSRAGITGKTFVGDAAIGMFLYGPAGITEAYNEADGNGAMKDPLNIRYYHGVEGDNDYFVSDNAIILSSKLGKLYGYYPYSENAGTDATVIPVKVNASQGTGISDGTVDNGTPDYMYSDVVADVCNTTTKVDMKMNHALAMVTFKFVRNTYTGKGVIDLIKLSNKVDGTYVKVGDGTMDITTGAVTAATAGSIYCEPKVELTGKELAVEIPHMLVYPTATEMAEGEVLLTIKMDGVDYEINLPNKLAGGASEAYKWEKGNNYIYTLTMSGRGFGNGVDGKEDIDVTIAEWNPIDVAEGDLANPKK